MSNLLQCTDKGRARTVMFCIKILSGWKNERKLVNINIKMNQLSNKQQITTMNVIQLARTAKHISIQ